MSTNVGISEACNERAPGRQLSQARQSPNKFFSEQRPMTEVTGYAFQPGEGDRLTRLGTETVILAGKPQFCG